MIIRSKMFLLITLVISLVACNKDDVGALHLKQVFAGQTMISLSGTVTEDLPVDRSLTVVFSSAVDKASAGGITLSKNGSLVPIDINFSNGDKTVLVHPIGLLEPNSTYALTVSDQLRGAQGETFSGQTVTFKTVIGALSLTSLKVGNNEFINAQRITDIPVTPLIFEVTFSASLNPATIIPTNFRITGFSDIPVTVALSNENRTVAVTASATLSDLRKYELRISDNVAGANEEPFAAYLKTFYTAPDPTPDFPMIEDTELLSLIQEKTFQYFWNFGHPASGMARERNTSGDIVTSGGSGFGIMSLIVGVERNFITRTDALSRMNTILTYLESADRFHGAWPHWLNGNTGKVVPFSPNDNGGDLVETSFLIQGLLTFRQYLSPAVAAENTMISRINALWESVEWDWYTQNDQDVLYWHWSPDKEWIMNHSIRGYNECLITYVLAAASTTHGIDAEVYHDGWASNGAIANGKDFYDIPLPLGTDFGGPLFFTHYSFLGLDPRNLSDTYANYWEQNVNHSLINHAYAVDNPKNFIGYSDTNWGLTASDNHLGYSAHSPTNDLGVISPTAAISSLPYTTEESLKAIRFFYYTVGDRLWGEFGFYDAFNITEGWTASSYLAIDQGPIIVMIENHRTQLLWNLFMSAPEVKDGLDKLGLDY